MKHLKTIEIENINESSSLMLNEIKRDLYMKFKKNYMDAVAKELKDNGIKVKKINMKDSEDFSNDTFTCSYKDFSNFEIKMSIRGVSLAPQLKNISGSYSTKVDAMVKKIEKLL